MTPHPYAAYAAIAAYHHIEDMSRVVKAHGGSQVATMYHERYPCGIEIRLAQGGQERICNIYPPWQAILTQLRREPPGDHPSWTPVQAQRVAWGLLAAWFTAQIPFIKAGLVTLDELRLSWTLLPSGEPVGARFAREPTGLADSEPTMRGEPDESL